jgi:hypothetical protein
VYLFKTGYELHKFYEKCKENISHGSLTGIDFVNEYVFSDFIYSQIAQDQFVATLYQGIINKNIIDKNMKEVTYKLYEDMATRYPNEDNFKKLFNLFNLIAPRAYNKVLLDSADFYLKSLSNEVTK